MAFGRRATSSNSSMHTAENRKSPLAALANAWSMINLLMFIITLALASHAIDGYFDRKNSILGLVQSPATIALLFFSVLASAVGLATNLFSFVHIAMWSEAARLSNLGINMITLALNWLAAGFGIRALRQDALSGSNRYGKEAKTLAAFHIILMLTTLLHVLSLSLFHHHDHRHVGNNGAVGTAVAGHEAGHHHNKLGHNNTAAAPMAGHQAAPVGTTHGGAMA